MGPSETTSADRRVARVALTAAAVAVLVLGGTIAAGFALPRLRPAPVPDGLAYLVGTELDAPVAAAIGPGPHLVLFAQATCATCDASRPVLGQLIKDASAAGLATAMVTTLDTPQTNEEFASSIGLGAERVALLNFEGLRIKRVPTLLVVDRAGVVIRSHEGLVTADVARTFVSAARALPINPDPNRR